MHTKTHQTIELQQSGENENKTLVTIWSPAASDQTCAFEVVIEGVEDGVPYSGFIHRSSGVALLLDTTISQDSTDNRVFGGGCKHSAAVQAVGDTLVVQTAYLDPLAPHTVDWKISITLEFWS